VSLYGRNVQWTAKPAVPVQLERGDLGKVLNHYISTLNDGLPNNGHVPPHWGEILPGASILQLQDITTVQRLSYLLVQVAGFAAVAYIAITLSRLVAESRGESPFMAHNVGRLRRIGALVLIGAPVASFGHWAVERWIVESSSASHRVAVYPYDWSSLPWWTMLVGAAVMVLAGVWKRGVQMAEDVRGLV
jgi:hypothetical protein